MMRGRQLTDKMESLIQKQPPVFKLRKVSQVVKPKKRFSVKPSALTSTEAIESLMSSCAGKFGALVLVGSDKPKIVDSLSSCANLLKVEFEGYYGYKSLFVYLVFFVLDRDVSESESEFIAALGPVLTKDRDDVYYVDAIDPAIRANHFFWSPAFNVETIKRMAVASLKSVENFIIKDVVLEKP